MPDPDVSPIRVEMDDALRQVAEMVAALAREGRLPRGACVLLAVTAGAVRAEVYGAGLARVAIALSLSAGG